MTTISRTPQKPRRLRCRIGSAGFIESKLAGITHWMRDAPFPCEVRRRTYHVQAVAGLSAIPDIGHYRVIGGCCDTRPDRIS